MIQLYQYHCHGTGFAMPLPDITSEPTRPEENQKNAAEMRLCNTQLPPNLPIRSLRMYCFLSGPFNPC